MKINPPKKINKGLKKVQPMTGEYLKANEDPLNQEAKRRLETMGVKPEPEALYSLQLAIKGLTTMRPEGWMAEYRTQALEAAEQLHLQEPNLVAQLLRRGEDRAARVAEAAADQSAEWLKAKAGAADAAEALGMNLWENLMEHSPQLSPPPSE